MSNSKISALTSATTPLAGTETLPIVQGGVTVKATVANITGAGAYAGLFTTLGATGDVTLGDATTDLVTVNGYMGVGAAPVASIGVYNASTALTTASQRGFQSSPTGTSAATTRVVGFWASPGTAATAYTSTTVTCFYAASVNKGAGSTITNANGLYIEDLTTGTNNYGITSLVSSGSNKWNIYASGTANNYFAGSVGISVTSPAVKLDVLGTIQAAAAATQDAVRLAGRAGGTGTFAVTLTPTTLTASRTLTLPDATTTVVGTDATQTLTNKWVQPRVLASTANSATPTLNTDNYDMMVITGQTVAITSFSTNLTGTPVNGQKLIIAITGTGAIGLTWGASFEASTVALPTTTVTTNRLDVGFIWNVATTKWRCVAVA